MIAAVVFFPQAPVLVPDVAQGAAPELADLRAACRDALRAVARPGRRLVLLGAGTRPAAHESTARGTLAGFGLPLEVALGADDQSVAPTLPPSLTVGAWLVGDALGPGSGAIAVEVTDEHNTLPAFDEPSGDEDVVLVVLGDGSARRTEKAPGYLDERAEPFDAHLADVLARGDGAALRRDRLATHAAQELLVSGLTAWDAVAPVVAGVDWDAELRYADAPYGVGYFVAVWTRRA